MHVALAAEEVRGGVGGDLGPTQDDALIPTQRNPEK